MEWKALYKTFGRGKFVRPHEFYLSPADSFAYHSVARYLAWHLSAGGEGKATWPFPHPI
jgi:hypothetical protein